MSLESRWQNAGLPADLLAKARELRIPVSRIESLLRWQPGPERMQLEVRWAELAMNGPIRWRQATIADNDEFCALWANSPEQIGEWDLTVERGPNGFAQFCLQERPVLNVLLDGAEMVACVGFSLRRTIVGGELLPVRYGQAMRVHIDHRRHGYGNWVRSLPWAVGLDMPTRVQYDFIRGGNMTMERWNSRHMPDVASVPKREGEVPGIPVTVLEYPARPSSGTPRGVRTATRSDLPRCVELINRTHRGLDLFRPYSVDYLDDRLDIRFFPADPTDAGPAGLSVYGLDDFFVVDRAGEIVACAGLWDRGRDLRERWRHRETGAERVVTATALLDFGFDEGAEDELAALVEYLVGRTAELGRDFLVAPLETLPAVAACISHLDPQPESRYMQWRTDAPQLTQPVFLDLVYW